MTMPRHALARHRPGVALTDPSREWGTRQQLLLALMHSRQREINLQAALAESEAARKSEATWSRMAAHELRSHLHALHLHLLLLQHKTRPNLDAGAAKAFDGALLSWNRLVEFVDTLLDVGRSRDGVRKLSQVDMGPLGAEVAANLKPSASERGLWLDHVDEGGPPIQTDERLVRIILTNLVDNALRYTREGGVTVRTRTNAAGVRIRVEDTGPGIPEEARNRLLEPYQRAQDGGERGAGLGLSIVVNLVRELGGQLDLKSQVGEGTCFTVWLPALA